MQHKEVYEKLIYTARVIPRPMQMMSASPDLLAIQVQSIGHYFRHPTLGFSCWLTFGRWSPIISIIPIA